MSVPTNVNWSTNSLNYSTTLAVTELDVLVSSVCNTQDKTDSVRNNLAPDSKFKTMPTASTLPSPVVPAVLTGL